MQMTVDGVTRTAHPSAEQGAIPTPPQRRAYDKLSICTARWVIHRILTLKHASMPFGAQSHARGRI